MIGPPFGTMDVDRHRALMRDGIFIHVKRNGEDVTNRCIFADDSPDDNHAILFCVDAFGKKYLTPDRHSVAKETVLGGVVMEEGPPF